MLAVATDDTMARYVCLCLDSHTCAPAETIEWNEIPFGRTLVWPPRGLDVIVLDMGPCPSLQGKVNVRVGPSYQNLH